MGGRGGTIAVVKYDQATPNVMASAMPLDRLLSSIVGRGTRIGR
jgi:hypothetical protein